MVYLEKEGMLTSFYIFTKHLTSLVVSKEEFIKKMEEGSFVFTGHDVETSVCCRVSEIEDSKCIKDPRIESVFGEHYLISCDDENKISLLEDNVINDIDNVLVFQKEDYFIKFYERRTCIKIILDL